MAHRVLPFAVSAALMLALAGCSNYERPRRPAWRGAAEKACLAQAPFRVSDFIQPAREIDGPGICGLYHPFKVSALLDGAVRFTSIHTLDCPMIARLNAWLGEIVQPAARARFGEEIVEVRAMGAYSCRTMNNVPGARLSEHAFGNAIDIGSFRLASGREISILRDWTAGDDQARAFLQDVHAGACGHFTTVLGPGANIFHYNHIHADLALHGNTASGPRRICRPLLGPSQLPGPPRDSLPNPPEIEEDIDIAEGKTPRGEMLALQAGPGPAPQARIPESYFASAARMPAARAYAPLPPESVGAPHGTGPARVPEGLPSDWDLAPPVRGR
ncbi:MAG: extensin family protein [Beijerinckiaceae bacterium]|nr:extensin family protein [Beijerinckiaceae bacterium]